MNFSLTRSLLVTFVPGFVGLGPWLLFLVEAVPSVRGLYVASPYFFQGAWLALVVVAGTMFEGQGSRAERLWDKAREAQYSVDANWWTYLSRSVHPEPVGYRYIARHASVLSFELSMAVATVVFGVGVAALIEWSQPPLSNALAILVILAGLGVGYLFHRSAWDTHELLCESRDEINARLGGQLHRAP